MKFKSIIGLLIVAIFSSIFSSMATVNYLEKKNMINQSQANKSMDSKRNTINIQSNNSGKSQNIYQAVAQKASPSVVGIVSQTVSEDNFFSSGQVQAGSGTGIVVDKRGYILTNSHVISDGNAQKVDVLFNDKKTSSGKVIWNDINIDLAILKVDRNDLIPAELGDSDKLNVGDISIAIGNPLGTDFMYSVTQGIISGLDRDISIQGGNMSGLIQTDASINPGNSGGPLLNQDGQVIGINTVKANADNLGFAIPINTAKNVVKRVVDERNYERALLGVSGIDVKTYESYTGESLGLDSGIIIRRVQGGTIAQKAGLKKNDIILKIGDTDIKNMGDVSKKMYSYSKGDKDTITVNRSGKTIKLNFSL